MTINQVFELIYYSHITLVILAMVLTGSISVVLFNQIEWHVILLVGISTYFTYSLDNLFDWKRDHARYRKILNLVQIYHKITYFLIPAAAIGLFFLIIFSPNDFQICILLLGAAVAMGTTRFSIYRKNSSNPTQSIFRFLINRFFISITWTTVCVFLPTWYNNIVIMSQTWLTFIYIFCLIFPYAVLWKFESSLDSLQLRLIESQILKILIVLPIFSMFIVITDVLRGIFPAINLINLMPPIAMITGLTLIQNNHTSIKKKVFLLTLVFISLCGISAAVHLYFG